MSGMRKSPLRPLETHEDRPRTLSAKGKNPERKNHRSRRKTCHRRFRRRLAVKEFFGQRKSAGFCAVDAGCEVDGRFEQQQQQQQQRREEELERLEVEEQTEEFTAGQS